MTPSLRSTRRTPSSQPTGNTGHDGQAENISSPRGTPSSKRVRNRLTTSQLTRLEDVFKQETHPNRQQKKDLAAELGMDYKTITIWFQNKRQTSKRLIGSPGQPLPTTDKENSSTLSLSGRTKIDSCLRTVSSPSHNATLDTASSSSSSSEVDSLVKRSQSKTPMEGLSGVASMAMAIVKMRPLFDTLNILTSKSREQAESKDGNENSETANHKSDAGDTQPLLTYEDTAPSTEISGNDEENETTVVQEPTKEKFVRWKRLRTLEWACERQTKRRKLTKEGYSRLRSEEAQAQDSDHDDLRMESALSLLSLASPARTHVGPPKDVIMGAALLASLKNSWSRK